MKNVSASQDTTWTPDFLARQIAEKSPEAIVVTDVAGIIRFWNTRAVRLFGYDQTEALGRSLDIIIPEKHRPAHWAGWRRVLETGRSRYSGDALLAVPGLRRDGSRVSLAFSIFVVHDDEEKIVGMGATLRDVTDQYREIKELRSRIAALEEAGAGRG